MSAAEMTVTLADLINARMWVYCGRSQEFHGACGTRIGTNLKGDLPISVALLHVAGCETCQQAIEAYRATEKRRTMKPTLIRVRIGPAGAHVDARFFVGRPGYTFALIGTLTMSQDDADLFRGAIKRAIMANCPFEIFDSLPRWEIDMGG